MAAHAAYETDFVDLQSPNKRSPHAAMVLHFSNSIGKTLQMKHGVSPETQQTMLDLYPVIQQLRSLRKRMTRLLWPSESLRLSARPHVDAPIAIVQTPRPCILSLTILPQKLSTD